MAPRILTAIVLLAMSSIETAAQLPPFRSALPPIAPSAATQNLSSGDRHGVLRAVAAYLRNSAGGLSHLIGDSVVLDPDFHPALGSIEHLRDQHHTHVSVPAEELEVLISELRAGTGTLESVQTNCRRPPLGGCDLTASNFVSLAQPVLRTDGTVTVAVEHRFNTPNGRPAEVSIYELVLTRTGPGNAWSVTARHVRVQS